MVSARRALVIGNTDGIGLALTRRLLREGWAVAGVSRRASSLGEMAGYRHAIADVATPEYPAALRALLASGGTFDACIFCAGIGELLNVDDLTAESRVFAVNLLGAVETAAIVLPAMRAAGRGHFVGLSSIGDRTSPDAPSYAASKAGLSSYLEGLALALRPHGVQVTNLRFGFVDTKMAKAKVRPFMIDAERAVEIIMRCLRRRPARLTYPKRMAALAWLSNIAVAIRLWLS
jgi:NAD(P)-dependent dehydrogenase (short-subunit alcohol dehydrogenase family)